MKSGNDVELDHFIVKFNDGVFCKKTGIKLKLHPKEFRVLCALVKHAGQLVSKEQLIHEVWQGEPASDESLARCIYSLKSSFRSHSFKSANYIKSEYGRGYRFVGNIIHIKNEFSSQVKKQGSIGLSKLADIITKGILTCTSETTVLEAVRILKDTRKSSLLILHNQIPHGIWTEADAVKLDFTNPYVLDLAINEVMQTPVFTIHENKTIHEATDFMRKENIRHLVVVDDEGKAVGVATPRDIIHSQGAEAFITVKDVKSVAYQNPFVIKENLKVISLASIMKQEHTDILIINIDNRPMFSFTERDLIELIAKQDLNITLEEIEIKPLITVSQDISILVARQLMDIQDVKHLAVLDEKGNFTKILSQSDILVSLESTYKKLLEDINITNSYANNDYCTQLLANAVHQTAGMMIITDCYGDIEYVNESFENMTGYKLDEIKGQNPRFLNSGTISKSLFKQMWNTLNLGKTWKGELCNKKKSGSKYWVLSSITPIVNEQGEIHHFIAVEEDITEKKEVEIRLREIENRFYKMIDHALVMTWEADSKGLFTYFNQAWLKFTGRNLQEELGNAWAKHIHPDDLHRFIENFQDAMVGRNSFCLDYRLQDANGDYVWVMNYGVPQFNEEGEFQGFKGECVDITNRREN